MRKRKNYRHINGVPEIFGLPASVFVQALAPMVLTALVFSVVGGLVVGFIAFAVVIGLYFFFLTQIKKYGPHFLRIKFQNFRNPFNLIIRRHSNLFFLQED